MFSLHCIFFIEQLKHVHHLMQQKNGQLRVLCSLGDDGVATHGDYCRFRCTYAGYVMSGSSFRKCITTHQGLQ